LKNIEIDTADQQFLTVFSPVNNQCLKMICPYKCGNIQTPGVPAFFTIKIATGTGRKKRVTDRKRAGL
jgi:hypothetical protein